VPRVQPARAQAVGRGSLQVVWPSPEFPGYWQRVPQFLLWPTERARDQAALAPSEGPGRWSQAFPGHSRRLRARLVEPVWAAQLEQPHSEDSMWLRVLPLGLVEPVWAAQLEQPYSEDSMWLRVLPLGLAEPAWVAQLEQPYSGDSMGLRALKLGLAEPVWAEVVQALRGWAARP
jgi:hypothetical protein